MPEPISCSSPPNPSDFYDAEQAHCAMPKGEPLCKQSPPTEASPSVSELVASHERARSADCATKVAKAGIACAGAVLATLKTAPTVAGGIASALIGGLGCGLAVAEAAECLTEASPSKAGAR